LLFIPGPRKRRCRCQVARGGSTKAIAAAVGALLGAGRGLRGYGLAFSRDCLIRCDDRRAGAVVMAIIALIGPMQVVAVLLMVGSATSPPSARRRIYFAFPISGDRRRHQQRHGLILFAIIYGVASNLVTILRGMMPGHRPEGYGGHRRATMPTVMRAAGRCWRRRLGAFGGYTRLWGLAASC
jgi:hypothetical protein